MQTVSGGYGRFSVGSSQGFGEVIKRVCARKKGARKLVTGFLSELVKDEEADMKDRLKASELLVKAAPEEGDEKTTGLTVRIVYGDGK